MLALLTACIPVRRTVTVHPAIVGRVLADGQSVAGARVVVTFGVFSDTARTDSLGTFATPGMTQVQRMLVLLPFERAFAWSLSVARDGERAVEAKFRGMGRYPREIQIACELTRDPTLRCTS
jgi:hypothetical protein